LNECFVCHEAVGKGFVLLEIPDDDGNDFEAKLHNDCFVCAYDGKHVDGAYIVHDGKVYCEEHEHTLYPDCGGCQEPIPFGSAMVKALDELWHESCFVCKMCKKPPTGASGGVEFHHKKKTEGAKTFITVFCPECNKSKDKAEGGDQFCLDEDAVKAKAERDKLKQMTATERAAKELAEKRARELAEKEAAAAAKAEAERQAAEAAAKAKADKAAAAAAVVATAAAAAATVARDAAAQKEKEEQKAKEKEAQIVEEKAAAKYAEQKAADAATAAAAEAAKVPADGAAGAEGSDKHISQRGGGKDNTYHEWGKVKKTQIDIDNDKAKVEMERIADEEKANAKAMLNGEAPAHESAKQARIRRQGDQAGGGGGGNTRVARGTRKNIRRGMTAGAEMIDDDGEGDESPGGKARSTRTDTEF